MRMDTPARFFGGNWLSRIDPALFDSPETSFPGGYGRKARAAMNSPRYGTAPDESGWNGLSRIDPALFDSPETSFPGGCGQ